jgi:hydroxymethylbilane synthase
LALWQAEEVARSLAAARTVISDPPELVVVETVGDRRQDVPVWDMGGQGVFVREVQLAVLEGRADLAVHSAKDLPSITAPGLVLAAVLRRGDPRDALVGSTLDALSAGATIATGSVRRRAQLAWIRPDLTFVSLRGNVATRLGRIPRGGALVMAAAALERLGMSERISQTLDPSVMLPQVGQGAIAVECREGDDAVRGTLDALNDSSSRAAVDAERAFLARLGGGCDLPAGAHATVSGNTIELEGLLATGDGRVLLRHRAEGILGRSEQLGRSLASDMLAAGGADLLGTDSGTSVAT